MRNGFVLLALTVAGVVGSVSDASAFFRKKRKKCDDVVVVPAVSYSQPPCGCNTGVGTSFATPSYHGGNSGYGVSGSHYAPSHAYPSTGYPQSYGTPGMNFPRIR